MTVRVGNRVLVLAKRATTSFMDVAVPDDTYGTVLKVADLPDPSVLVEFNTPLRDDYGMTWEELWFSLGEVQSARGGQG